MGNPTRDQVRALVAEMVPVRHEPVRSETIAAWTDQWMALLAEAPQPDADESEDYSAPEDHAFVGQFGDMCEVCRYAQGATWHYLAPQPKVLWEAETVFLGSREEPRPDTSWLVHVPYVLDVPSGTRVALVVIEDTETPEASGGNGDG